MQPEGAVRALRNAHRALVPDGVLLDLHSCPPAVSLEDGDGRMLGRLDEDEFLANVAAVEQRLGELVAAGLFEPAGGETLVLRERFPDAETLLDDASEWEGTRVPAEVAAAARASSGPIYVLHSVVLHAYRRNGRE